MVLQACDLRIWEGNQDDKEFKAVLGYIVSLESKLAYMTLSQYFYLKANRTIYLDD